MKVSNTARPLRAHLKRAVSQLVRRACEDLGISLASIADNLDVTHALIQNWANDEHDASAPIYALGSSTAVSDALFERVVSDLRTLRAQQAAGMGRTAEGVAGSLLMRAGAAIEEIATALADGRISTIEAPGVLRKISRLESECGALRKSLAHLDGRSAS